MSQMIQFFQVLHGFITAFFVSLIMLIVYCKFVGDRRDFNNRTVRNLFWSFLRPLWALSLGWIIFACVNGYAGKLYLFINVKFVVYFTITPRAHMQSMYLKLEMAIAYNIKSSTHFCPNKT